MSLKHRKRFNLAPIWLHQDHKPSTLLHSLKELIQVRNTYFCDLKKKYNSPISYFTKKLRTCGCKKLYHQRTNIPLQTCYISTDFLRFLPFLTFHKSTLPEKEKGIYLQTHYVFHNAHVEIACRSDVSVHVMIAKVEYKKLWCGQDNFTGYQYNQKTILFPKTLT